jgi:hypothetical protein
MKQHLASLVAQPIRLVPSAARHGGALAARLAKELRGDVHFDAASRGRYATDASIYQIMPIGVAVPRDQVDALVALDIARDLKVPRAAPARANAGRRSPRRSSSTTANGSTRSSISMRPRAR